jgi:arginine exporter protein ArgO
MFMLAATLFGILFLSFYGITSIMKAIKKSESFIVEENKEITWKILDFFIGITMLLISWGLIQFTIKNHF